MSVFTDASDEGYVSFILKHLNKKICSTKFKGCEKQTRSTQREILVVKYVLDSIEKILRNQCVQVNIDNSSSAEFYPSIVLSDLYRILLLIFFLFVPKRTKQMSKLL